MIREVKKECRHFSGSTVAAPPFNKKYLCAAASAKARQRKQYSFWENFQKDLCKNDQRLKVTPRKQK
jgi:hypothetical protein